MPIRYARERDKTDQILRLTSLTVSEFEALVPLVNTAFLAHMAEWTLEGKPRTSRRYTQYANCPLPTPEDRLLFVLMYLKGAPLQTAHATAFELTQPKANLWLHVLLTALRNALASCGDLPTRSLQALRERLAILTTAASAQEPKGEADMRSVAPFFRTAPSGQSRDPRTRLNRKTTTAARRNGI
jgi:Helix-turn-helix of DDE superfamily endonuclease